ncbi:MAG TPA: carboxypeptidase-like regulatory domain-containing protein, partial [Longimicrobiaceae bacterium]|nr:carboxypeptidase-like regulatory domain-containing protein [Longimicrobiaceae bacterium]
MPRLFLLALLLLPAAAAAQGAAAVSGRVTGPAGAPVQGAIVSAFPEAGGPARRVAATGADGTYRLAGLPPGAYRIRATRLGFDAAEREVSLAAGADLRVDLQLAERSVALDPVEARSRRDTERERARFETEAGVTARVIGGRELKVLPGMGEADVLRAVEVLP